MVGVPKVSDAPRSSVRETGHCGRHVVILAALALCATVGVVSVGASAEQPRATSAVQNGWGPVLYRVAKAKGSPASAAWALRVLETGIARSDASAASTAGSDIGGGSPALSSVPVGERFPPGPAALPQASAANGLAWSLPVTDVVPPISDDLERDANSGSEREVLTVLQSEFLRKRGQLAAPVAYARQRAVTATAEGPALLFETTPGTKVLAAASGRVAFADGPTHRVILEHGEGYYTVYIGIGECTVRAGDLVGARSPLGLTGSGSLTFQVRSSGSALDPLLWLGLH